MIAKITIYEYQICKSEKLKTLSMPKNSTVIDEIVCKRIVIFPKLGEIVQTQIPIGKFMLSAKHAICKNPKPK